MSTYFSFIIRLLRIILRRCSWETIDSVRGLIQYKVNSMHGKCWKSRFCEIFWKKNNRNREEGPWLVCFEMLVFLRLISNIDLYSAACYSCTGTEEECGPTVSRDDVSDANKRVSIETCENLQTHACWVRQGFAISPFSIGLTNL